MRISLFLAANVALAAVAAPRPSVSPFFWANHGQAPEPVRFVARAAAMMAYFSPGEVAFRVEGATLRVQFDGAGEAVPEPMERLSGVVNFLVGPEERWSIAQPLYGAILYRNLYPGVDMVYGGGAPFLKSEFVIAPGADPSKIRVRYGGVGQPAIEPDGSLAIPMGSLLFREEAPAIYQERDGRRIAVEGRFVLAAGTVSFGIGEYDASLPLVIDPAISYSTLLGGAGADAANALAVDAAGAAYIAGFTESSNLPTSRPAQNFNAGGNDVFVAKLSPAGDQLEYCTYLGGSGDDRAYGIAVDAAGAAYITGSTTSRDFPTRTPLQSKLAGARNAFILKLSPAGSIVYSTYLGGSSSDTGNGIAVDAAGSAYVAGDTTSINFPAAGWQKGNRGGQDAFVAKLSADGSLLAYSTYLGGNNTDHGAAIAVDASGAAWVAGSTWSADFPLAHALQGLPGGGQDAFIARLSADGNALPFSTYLGGSGGTAAYPETAQAIALDWEGNAYVAGVTSSLNFPLLNPAQASLRGGTDAFVAKVSLSGTLAYSTYLGGSGVDAANAIAVDSAGTVFIAGYTYSTDLPLAGAVQASNAGDCDAFLAKLSPAGALQYASYLGGNGADTATAVAVGPPGAVYTAGWTLSTNFPLLSAFQTINFGNYGAFVTKLNFGSPPANAGVTPNAGSGSSATFTFQFSDPAGAANLTSASVLFNSTPNAVNGCAVLFDPSKNALWLLADDGEQPATSIAPGNGSQQNSQCALNGAASSVSMAGTILTLNLALTFQPAMAGTRNIYMQAANPAGSTGWEVKGSWTIPALVQINPANGNSLTAYLSSTRYIDFSTYTDFVWGNWASPTYGAIGDGDLTVTFSSPVARYTIEYSPYLQFWNVWPYSQRTDDHVVFPVLIPFNPRFNQKAEPSAANWPMLPMLTITPSTPVRVFGFEALSDCCGADVTATFFTATGPALTVTMATPLGGSRIFAASGGAITRIDVSTTDMDIVLGAFRYALPLAGSIAATTAGASVAPAELVSPANGSTLPGSGVTFQWSVGAGVSEYWLYVSKVAPGGKEIYSGSQGLNTAKPLTGLPADGSVIYVRLWSKIGSTWLFSDYTFKTANPSGPVMVSPVNGSTLPGSTVTFQWSAGIGISEYWLYLSKVAPGGRELYSGSQGLNTSKTFTDLPIGGGAVYVRLWSKTARGWQYADYSYNGSQLPWTYSAAAAN